MQLKLTLRKTAELGIFLTSIVALALVGCAKSSSTTPTSTSSSLTTLSGVVAAGTPVVNGAGYALDSTTGTQYAFTTNASGVYSVNVNNSSGPFLIHVTGVAAGSAQVDEYSIATSSNLGGVLNVTPLTNLVLASAAGKSPQNLETACTANQSACPALLNGILTNLSVANTALTNALSSVLTQFGITPSTFNALTSTFTAGSHSGIDGMLDVLNITSPVSGVSTGYQITLAGASTPLATVPLGGTVTVTPGTTVTPAALIQAQNLTAALNDIQSFYATFTNLFATSFPSSAVLSTYFDPSYLYNGNSAASMISNLSSGNMVPIGKKFTGGGLAPYGAVSGVTPVPSVSYDANNCVTSIWVQSNMSETPTLFNNTIPSTNLPGTCTGGTWLMAGNQNQYFFNLGVSFTKVTHGVGATPSYDITFNIDSNQSQTINNAAAVNPYDTLTVFGPGLVTYGNQTTESPVTLVPLNPTWNQNSVVDTVPYLAGQSQFYIGAGSIVSCAAIAAGTWPGYAAGVPYGIGKWTAPLPTTPCFNSNLVSGSDYTVNFYNGGTGGTLLETDMVRLYVTPAAATVPASWYPTITSISPNSAAGFVSGVPATLTVNWTLPSVATATDIGVQLQDSSNNNVFTNGKSVLSTATLSSMTVTPTGTPVKGGILGTGSQFSSVWVDTTVGGMSISASCFF